MNKIAVFWIIMAFVIGVICSADYADELAEQNNYCKMVKNKAWPDFRKLYEKIC